MILLCVLNDCVITTDSTRITPRAKLLFSLALYLIIERGKFVPRDLLTSLLWPKIHSNDARSLLRRLIWQLRKDGFPITSKDGVHIFLPKDSASLDLDTLINECDPSLLTRPINILPWIPPQDTPQLHDWVDDARYLLMARLSLHLSAATVNAQHAEQWELMATLADRALEIDPQSTTARAHAEHARRMLDRARSDVNGVKVSSSKRLPSELSRSTLPPRYHPSSQHTRLPLLNESQPTNVARAPNLRATSPPALATSSHLETRLQARLAAALQDRGSTLHLYDQLATHHALKSFAEETARFDILTIVTELQHTHTHTPLAAIQSIITALRAAPGAAGCAPDFLQHLDHGESLVANQLSETTRLALLDLIDAVSDEQPLVIIVEHVHYADPLSLSLLTAIASHCPTRAILLITTSPSTPHSTTLPPPPHDDLELLTLSARRHTERQWRPLADAAHTCLSSVNAPLHHRFEAGALLCTLAATLSDASLIHSARRTLDPLSPPPLPTDTSDSVTIPKLKFHSAANALAGDPHVANRAITQLLALVRQTRRGIDLINSLIFCGNCLHWCGNATGTSSLYQEAYALAIRHKCPSHAAHAAHSLAHLALDRGDTEVASMWNAHMIEYAPTQYSLWERHATLLLHLRLALAQGDRRRSAQLCRSADELLPDQRMGIQVRMRACELRLFLLQNAQHSIITQKAEELLALSSRLCDLRIFHYEFFSLYLAFEHLGQPERGIRPLKDYLDKTHPKSAPLAQEVQTWLTLFPATIPEAEIASHAASGYQGEQRYRS